MCTAYGNKKAKDFFDMKGWVREVTLKAFKGGETAIGREALSLSWLW